MPACRLIMPTIALPPIPAGTRICRRRNLNSEKNKPTMSMMKYAAGKGKLEVECLGKSLKLSIHRHRHRHRPTIDKFTSPSVNMDDETSEFEELEVYEAHLNEEYWSAAWLRAECLWENLENDRYAENFKWMFAEREFVALKKRCDEQVRKKNCKCIMVVKKDDGSGFVNRVVGTLDLSIRYFSQGQTFPEEAVVPPPPPPNPIGVGVGAMNRRKSNKYAYITNLCVAKSARRRGVGTIMLQHAISTAHHHGIQRVFLRVHGDNEPALTLYQNMGFKVVEAANSAESSSGQPLLLLCFQAST